jgi:glycolate oxidase FAD binding subunit
VSALRERLAAVLGTEMLHHAAAAGARPVVAPATIEGAAEALRLASRDRLRVAPAGGLTHRDAGAGADFVLSSTRMRRIVEHHPEDLVAVVEAGVPLVALDRALAAHGQRLAPDPWAAGDASIGAAVAANRCGLSRRARGTWRDAVLGARVVHADGRVSKTGGRVVKNVAGFDLAKLYVGSHGSLVWIAEVAVRLVVRAPVARTLMQRCPRAAAPARLLALHRAALAPQALLFVAGAAVPGVARPGHDGDGALVVRFEGTGGGVDAQVATATQVAGVWDDLDAAAWDALRGLPEPHPGVRVLRLCGRPTAGMAWLDALAAFAVHAAVVEFGAGIAHLHVPHDTDTAALAARVAAAGARIGAAPATGGDPVARWLAHATKQALDPLSLLPAHPDQDATV